MAPSPPKPPSPKILAALAALAKKKAQAPAPAVTPAPSPTPAPSRLLELLAASKRGKLIATGATPSRPLPSRPPAPAPESNATGISGEAITYNENQRQAIELGVAGTSFVLTGAAGTGKTTCSQGVIKGLIESGNIGTLNADRHSHLRDGTPGIVVISFTRRAVNNIRKVQIPEMKLNCITGHKLLEYQPEYFELESPDGTFKRTMSFTPARNMANPLPSSIQTIIVEEASMLAVSFYQEILDALPHKVQWIFIGDINQLPPVFGAAIMGYKLLELPVVELTEVYRQALESPIIRLAHRVLSGKVIPVEEYPDWKIPGELTIHPW